MSAATDNVGTVTGVVASGGVTDDTVLVLSGTNEASATVNVYNGSTLLGAATISGTTWSYNATVANGTTYTFNAKETDVAGNVSAATSNYTITGDTTAPVFSSGATANFAENGAGTAYDATADSDSGVTYTTSGTDASLFSINPSTGLVTFATSPNYEAPADAGANNIYNLNVIATDAAGNATTQAVAITVTDVVDAGTLVIDLGSFGKLIAPVQVEGAWYYFWDRSGNGTSADMGALNGGNDFVNHNVLDGIFTSTLAQVTAGTVGTGTDTTDQIRYANLNGVRVALPTANGGVAYPQGTNAFQNGTSYTDAGVSTNGTTGTFNELLAIWDAYNGTGTGTNSNGTPSGWQAGDYWSATPETFGHAIFDFATGIVGDNVDLNNGYVALQVL